MKTALCISVAVSTALLLNTAQAQNLLINGDLESDPWLDGWLASTNVVQFGGLASGSTRSANLNGIGQRLGQNPFYAAPDWFLDFYFAVRDAGANRAFSLLVNQAANGDNTGAATINLRYQTAQFNTFASGSWGTDLGLGTIDFSTDANNDGDLNDAGDKKNIYHMRVTGHGWGTPSASYDIELSEPNSTNLTRRVNGITRYQNGSGVNGPPLSFVFNTYFGSNPGFWVDDLLFGVIELPDDPNLELVLEGELFGRLAVDSPATTRSLVISNSGFANTLVISNAVTSGVDAARYSVGGQFPMNVPPQTATNLEITLDPQNESRAFAASLALVSNDPSNPQFSVNLSAVRLLTGTQMLQNGDFESVPFPTGWLSSAGATKAAGLDAGSTTAAWLSTTGIRLGQNVAVAPDWHMEFSFAITNSPDSTADLFGFYVTSIGDIFNTGEIKLRLSYTNGGWSFLNAERPELGTLLPSTDSNGDGDLNDGSDVKNVYRLRIVGHAWNTTVATVDVEISNANGSTFARGVYSLPLNTSSAVPYGFAFTSGYNNNPGFWVDSARLLVGLPALEFTEVKVVSGLLQMRWNSEPGASYVLDTTTNLGGSWQAGAFGPVTSQGSSTSFTNTISGDRLFFRLRKQ